MQGLRAARGRAGSFSDEARVPKRAGGSPGRLRVKSRLHMSGKLGDAVNSVIEMLEARRLLHDGSSAAVIFAPAGTEVAGDYHTDNGGAYGPQEEGHFFGWSSDNAADVGRAATAGAPDSKYDTFEYLPPGRVWEIAVENGDYQVRVGVGGAIDRRSAIKIDVEGVRTIDRDLPRARQWVD